MPGDPADAWSVIASPFLPKYLSSPRCAALHGALYLIGDNTKKVYAYDPGANLWQKVRPLRLPPRGQLPGLSSGEGVAQLGSGAPVGASTGQEAGRGHPAAHSH